MFLEPAGKNVIVASFFLPNTVSFNSEDKVIATVESTAKTQPTIPKIAIDNLRNGPQASVIERMIQKKKGLSDSRPERDFSIPRSRNASPTRSPASTPPVSAKENKISPKRQQRRKSVSASSPDSPWTVTPCSIGNIGLHNAVNSIADKLGTRTWIGTLSTSTEDLSERNRNAIKEELKDKHDCLPVFLSDAEMDGHYNKFCKQVLWPMFHYILPEYPQSLGYEDEAWQHCLSVNRKFADAVVEVYQPGDIIWVNDYHLMLLPAMIRDRIPEAKVGFFLHIPFPSSEIFRCLHVRRQILEGVLGADLVGFQTYSFARHFLENCSRVLSYESSPKGIQFDDRFVSVGIFPIGIDASALNEKRNIPDVTEIATSLREKYGDKKLVIGRDKLDYVKGVRQKMLAFEMFLNMYPDWRGNVILLQISLPTTEHNELQGQVSDIASRINAKYGSLSYQPVIYLHQEIDFSQYLALLTVADSFMITSLRDGMNLTSHEYVMCQEEKCSPLIISEFAGTYGSFGAAAIRVNPWDTRQLAQAINESLSMPDEERAYRWKELHDHVITNSAQFWAESFIDELDKAHGERRSSVQIPHITPFVAKPAYQSSQKRLFFLDYDGTLAPYVRAHSNPASFDRVKKLLESLTDDPKNTVYIMSGRTTSSLDEVLGSIPNLGFSAENGCFVKHPGSDWERLLSDNDFSWQGKVREIFEYYTERTPGSYIESKEVALVWDYRLADNPSYGAWQAAECQNHIQDALGTVYPIHVVGVSKNLEVLPRSVSKSNAVHRVLEANPEADFIVAIGDDRTDEDMFEALENLQLVQPEKSIFTCTVGSKTTQASYFASSVNAVLSFLSGLPDQK
ncbi:Trehalose-6-P synthase/phosphatase complex subunit [Basidiobolus ranarum]|uniref:Trehalose-6-P synthase/phosphatase complex subunit n=1 Tax=Basidiobolus ranarum TaxID=34480 RepID=A0ABR2WNW5_9FUNG